MLGFCLQTQELHGEGTSNSIIEYMALRKPVIATRGGGTNEVVFDNYNGFLIDAGNSDQLSEKIIELIKNDNRKELGEKGYQMVHDKFDLKIMTNEYIKFYTSRTRKNKEI